MGHGRPLSPIAAPIRTRSALRGFAGISQTLSLLSHGGSLTVLCGQPKILASKDGLPWMKKPSVTTCAAH